MINHPYPPRPPVQYTDDASRETPYRRRRCFNCHTTKATLWRKSPLNVGKILCNKCGLYERTNLKTRPLTLDVGGWTGVTTAGRSSSTDPSLVPDATGTKPANLRSSGIVLPASLGPSLTGARTPIKHRTSVSSSNSDSSSFQTAPFGLPRTPSLVSCDGNPRSPPLEVEGIPIHIPIPFQVSIQSPHLRETPYNSTPPLSTSLTSSNSSLPSSLSSFPTLHQHQPIMNSLNPIDNTYSIPPVGSLTGGMIPNPLASLTDDSSHLRLYHPQLHQHHRGFITEPDSRTWAYASWDSPPLARH